jgi:hypothetical protein
LNGDLDEQRTQPPTFFKRSTKAFANGLMLARAYARFGSPNPYFYWAAFFRFVCIAINWWYYARKGAEKPC